jgi:hypothetical protein
VAAPWRRGKLGFGGGAAAAYKREREAGGWRRRGRGAQGELHARYGALFRRGKVLTKGSAYPFGMIGLGQEVGCQC